MERPHLALGNVGDQLAVGRYGGIAALGEQAWLSAFGTDDPELLLGSHGNPGWVGDGMALALHVVATDVDEAGGIRRKLRGVDLLAVVVGVVGDLAGDVALAAGRGFGDPQVAAAVDVRHPLEAALRWRGEEVGGKGRAEGLLNREGLRLREAGWSAEHAGGGNK